MTEFYNRGEWGARAARGGPGALTPGRVVGIALHWPAMRSRLGTVEAVQAALRSWQDYHMDTNGWSDIAYQEAFDQLGNVYRLRGLRNQSGANGNTDLNERFGALLLILAPGEAPTPAMVAAVQRRIELHRDYFPNSERIVGHGQIRPGGTQCPGPIVQAMINRGAFEPAKPNRVERGRKLIQRGLHTLDGVDDERTAVHKGAKAIRAALDGMPRR